MYRRVFLIICLIFVIIGPFYLTPRLSSGYQQSGLTGVIVPLYNYPGQEWNQIVQAKQTYPSVPVIAIVNPSNGPGGSQDPNFVSGIQLLRSAGITVMGYVPTGYGSVSTSVIDQEIYRYTQMYQLNGIFFDQMANVPGFESYYAGLTAYAKSMGYSMTMGNPGSWVPPSYIGTVDNIVIYENSGLPDAGFLSTLGYQRSDFSLMSYGDSSLDTNYVLGASASVGYLYITDGNWPSPYTALPTYFLPLLSTLSVIDSSSVSLTVDSVDMAGNPISGLWTVLQTGGNIVQSGFTPEAFSVTSGDQYQVTASNYASYVFDHWGNGSTSNTESLTASGPITLVAYYRSTSDVSLSVNWFGTYGTAIPGLWRQFNMMGIILHLVTHLLQS
ncbi:MAG TPA: spherulation-specific family 4 protein [Nitrososphaerales archaeon]|nr:spherulation-specific family 4 protein [Nitrososphaerales archaeon]